MYGNANIVNNQRVVFNIKGNGYRLIVSVNFQQHACNVIWFGIQKLITIKRNYDELENTKNRKGLQQRQ